MIKRGLFLVKLNLVSCIAIMWLLSGCECGGGGSKGASDNISPVITGITSSTPNGIYGPGSVINVTVTFS